VRADFGHRVQGQAGGGDAVGQRAADRDDPAALAHLPGGSLAGDEDRPHIDGPQPVGLLDRRFLEGAAGEHPGVVDQDVEPAQLRRGLLDRGDDGAGIGAVRLDDQHP